MVFVETKRQADFIAAHLCQEKVPTTSIHGYDARLYRYILFIYSNPHYASHTYR